MYTLFFVVFARALVWVLLQDKTDGVLGRTMGIQRSINEYNESWKDW